MVTVVDVGELHRDPQASPRPPHAAFEHGAHVELAANRSDVLLLSLESEDRCPGDDVQPVHLGECADQLLGHSVGEELVLGVWTEIEERQYRERLVGNRGCPGLGSRTQCRRELRRRGEPVIRSRGERPEGRRLDRLGNIHSHLPQALGWSREPCGDHALGTSTAVRRLTRKHLVEHTGQAVDVAPGINRLSHRLLGTHVGRSAYRETDDCELGFVLGAESACDAEVGQECMPTGEEDVLRLDVAVHDAVLVGISQPVGYFAHDLERWFHLEPSFAQQSSP